MDPVLTVTAGAAVLFTARRMLTIGHAFQRAIVILMGQLPPGTRIVVRFGGAELQLLIAPSKCGRSRSETET